MLVASLRELQQLFWRSLADEWDTIAPELVEAVLPSSTLDSSARVQVYAGAYSSRLLDVLHEDFPRLAALLGRDGFEQIARDYLRSHPSEHPSLRHLSRAMAAFLERRTDLPPYLADLARLEWARIDVFDAPDAEPLPVAALRSGSHSRTPGRPHLVAGARAVGRHRSGRPDCGAHCHPGLAWGWLRSVSRRHGCVRGGGAPPADGGRAVRRRLRGLRRPPAGRGGGRGDVAARALGGGRDHRAGRVTERSRPPALHGRLREPSP